MITPKCKIIFMGTPEITIPTLETLHASNDFEISAVVTQEDKRVGRKQELQAPPVKKWALEKGIPVLQPPVINNNKEFFEILKSISPDFIVVFAYGRILPKSILELPKFSCLNIHVSLLPKYRGASPIEESLLNGDKETGISIMKMVEKLDAGPLYLVKKVEINQSDDAQSLRSKISIVAGLSLPTILKEIMDGNLNPIPQNESKATYCRKITKDDGLIDLEKNSAEEIVNKIRAYNPWPNCYLFLEGKRLKLLQAKAEMKKNDIPGKIIELDKNSIAIGTKKGLLIPHFVQLEGKPAMKIQDFLLGNRKLLKNSLVRPK